jgi:hypothetical protein
VANCEVDHVLGREPSERMLIAAGACAMICFCASTVKLWVSIQSELIIE